MNAILNNTVKYGASLGVTLVVLVVGVAISLLSAFGQLI